VGPTLSENAIYPYRMAYNKLFLSLSSTATPTNPRSPRAGISAHGSGHVSTDERLDQMMVRVCVRA